MKLTKKINFILIYLLTFTTVFCGDNSSVRKFCNSMLEKVFNLLIKFPIELLIQIMKAPEEKLYKNLNLVNSLDEIAIMIGINLIIIFSIIEIINESIEFEKIDYTIVISKLIRMFLFIALIKSSSAIDFMFKMISNVLANSLALKTFEDGLTLIELESGNFAIILINFILSLIVQIATAFAIVSIIASFLMRFIKILIYNFLMPLYLSLLGHKATSGICIDFLKKFFLIYIQIVLYFLVINIMLQLPTIVSGWVTDTGLVAALLKNIILAVTIQSLAKGINQLTESLS